MRRYIIGITIVILLTTSCENSTGDYRDGEPILNCMNFPRPDDAYEYPVLPGMEEWRFFSSTEEMIEACQIDPGLLENLTTQAVFQALWEYPFFFEYGNRDQYQRDFEGIFSNNNAYKEFLKRTDAGEVLYQRLLSVKPLCEGTTVYSRGLELFLSQDVFLQQLNDSQKQSVVSVSLQNDAIRQKEIDGTDGLRTVTALLLARVLYSADYKPFTDLISDEMIGFINTSEIHFSTQQDYDNFIQLIMSYAYNFTH